jgi:predicted ATPase
VVDVEASRCLESVWQVRLLGGLCLEDGRQQLTRLPSRATTALLARLALAPWRTHAREELIELLWPGVALEVGRNRLRQALSTLKSILEPASRLASQPVLLADRLGIRVAPGALQCDAVEFERLLHAGQADAARALYRGELLPGFYDEWIEDERLRLAALADRLEPLPMPAPAAAAAASTTPATAEPRAAAARVALPTYLTRMFGADAQAMRLRERVLAHRLVTLIGPGGSGKTRLAVEVAHSLRAHADWPLPVAQPAQPFDLIAFVPLVACTDRAQALDAITGALQVEVGGTAAMAALTAALAERRTLLVLDNFEQLVGRAEGLVAELVAALPALHVVITSRRALGLDGEREFPLAALEVPAAGQSWQAAAASPALSLYIERAQAVRADFHLGARNGAVLVELVRALEGMPLAIELAASRVRSISPAQMLERLRGGGTPQLDLLARGGPRGAADPRHASMQRVIAWSWDQLTADQARLLSGLTAFAGDFSAAAAVALADSQPFDALLLLDDLLASSLLFARSDDADGSSDDEPRFGLYQPIREFAASQQDASAARQWRAGLRGWALQWVRALPRTPSLVAVRREMPNLLAALRSAVADAVPADAVQLLIELRRCLEDVELPAQGLADAQAAVEACADAPLKARGHSALAPLLFHAGQSEAALRHAELGSQCGRLDDRQRARALHALARVRWRSRRRADEVEPLLDQAQRLAEAADDVELRASLLALRAFVVNAHHRDYRRGEQLHGQALALWEQLGNQSAIDSGRYNLAVCAQNAGLHRQSLDRLAPVMDSARERQDWRRLSQSLNVRGNAHSGLRAWPQAVADYRECIRVAWRSMASYDLAYGFWNLPRALAHLRQPAGAIRLAAYAAHFWRSRFGVLSADDERYLLRVRRLVARQGLDSAQIDALWQDGERLSLPDALALALETRTD